MSGFQNHSISFSVTLISVITKTSGGIITCSFSTVERDGKGERRANGDSGHELVSNQ